MSEFKTIKSSNLDSAAYDGATGKLIVKFKNGTKYAYENIWIGLWEKFEATFDGANGASAGKFFNQNIKHLPCEKIGE